MGLLLCFGLLLTAAASEIVHEQGAPASQQSCWSDQDTVTLLQTDVQIPDESARQGHNARVIEEQMTQEDGQEDDVGVSLLQSAVRIVEESTRQEDDAKVVEEQTTQEDDQEEDDEELQVDEQSSREDDQEKQISAMAEEGRSAKPVRWRKIRQLWERSFTIKAIGQRICNLCLGVNQIGKCSQKGLWPRKSVRVDTSRRRDEGSHECMAVSTERKPKDWLGFGIHQNRLKGTEAAHRSSKKKMCTCFKSILRKCQDADCIQEKICGCPAVCQDFKIDLGCKGFLKGSLLEQASGRNNISESLSSVSRASSGTGVQTNLDASVQGKCSSETQ